MKIWKNTSLSTKIILVGLAFIMPFAITIFLYLIPTMKSNILVQKKIMIKNVVKSSISIVEGFYRKYQAGDMKEDIAQKQALKTIETLRYGPENKDYVSAIDLNGVSIMHPYGSKFVGTNISHFIDKKGFSFIKEIIRVCKKNGSGYVNYMWNFKDKKTIVPKITYNELFKPWGWLFGTGIYIKDLQDELNILYIKMIAVFGSITFLLIAALLYVSRMIKRQAYVARDNFMRASEGHLNLRLGKNFANDEIGQIYASFAAFIKRLQEITEDVREFVVQLSASSEELSSSSVTMSQNTNYQANLAKDINSSIDSNFKRMETINSNANLQFTNIKKLTKYIEILNNDIKDMKSRVDETQKQTENVAKRAQVGKTSLDTMTVSMKKIDDSSQKMANITEIISDISDQINLLSLNAAIEAARAGEVGRGFAVVADEISQLADQTAISIGEISTLIISNKDEIQVFIEKAKEMVEVINTITQGVISIESKIRNINESMEQQLESNKTVNEKAENVKLEAAEIKLATEEEMESLEQIVKDITEVNKATQSNAIGADELASNAEELARIAEKLKEKMDFFKEE